MMGGRFWYEAPAALGLTLLQMCSGRMGIQVRDHVGLGRGAADLHRAVGSMATASLMDVVRLE